MANKKKVVKKDPNNQQESRDIEQLNNINKQKRNGLTSNPEWLNNNPGQVGNSQAKLVPNTQSQLSSNNQTNFSPITQANFAPATQSSLSTNGQTNFAPVNQKFFASNTPSTVASNNQNNFTPIPPATFASTSQALNNPATFVPQSPGNFGQNSQANFVSKSPANFAPLSQANFVPSSMSNILLNEQQYNNFVPGSPSNFVSNSQSNSFPDGLGNLVSSNQMNMGSNNLVGSNPGSYFPNQGNFGFSNSSNVVFNEQSDLVFNNTTNQSIGFQENTMPNNGQANMAAQFQDMFISNGHKVFQDASDQVNAQNAATRNVYMSNQDDMMGKAKAAFEGTSNLQMQTRVKPPQLQVTAKEFKSADDYDEEVSKPYVPSDLETNPPTQQMLDNTPKTKNSVECRWYGLSLSGEFTINFEYHC